MKIYIRIIFTTCLLLCGQAWAEDFPLMDCVITPSATAEVSSPVTGVIETMHVVRSDSVKRGQTIATLDARVEKANLELSTYRSEITSPIFQAKIREKYEEKDSVRADKLYKQKNISEQHKDDAQRDSELSEWEVQDAYDQQRLRQLELERARQLLEQRTIRSPIDGYVVQRYKNPGEYIEEQALVRVATLDPLHIEAIIPLDFFGKVEAGLAAYIYPETAAEGDKYIAHVDIVDTMGDAASGTFGARLKMSNPGSSVPAGQKCNLQLLDRNHAHSKGNEHARQKQTVASVNVQQATTVNNTQAMQHSIDSVTHSEATSPAVTPAKKSPSDSLPLPLTSCYTAGPFASKKQVDTFAKDLGETVGWSVRQDKSSETILNYIVLIEKKSFADINLPGHFRDNGISNFLYMGKGPYSGHYSMGVYVSKQAALRRLRQLESIGLASSVKPRTAASDSQYWLDLRYLGMEDFSQYKESLVLPDSVSLSAIDCGMASLVK